MVVWDTGVSQRAWINRRQTRWSTGKEADGRKKIFVFFDGNAPDGGADGLTNERLTEHLHEMEDAVGEQCGGKVIGNNPDTRRP